MPEAQTTNVQGYFNPNGYPLTLSISSHNLTVVLNPKEWVANAAGVVNDPILDRYVQRGMLTRVVKPSQQYPINPLTAAAVLEAAHKVSGHSPVGEATRKAPGVPVRPAQSAAPTTPVDLASKDAQSHPESRQALTAMSMADARRLKLVRTPRVVPEDYGAEDTGSGHRGEIPDLIAAEDAPSPNRVRTAPVILDPKTKAIKEAVEVAGLDVNDENLLVKIANLVRGNKAEPVPLSPKANATPEKLTAPPIPEFIVANVSATPPPEEEVLIQESLPEPIIEEAKPEVAAPATPAPTTSSYVCAADGRTFNDRKYLLRHIRANFQEREEELMAPYPKVK